MNSNDSNCMCSCYPLREKNPSPAIYFEKVHPDAKTPIRITHDSVGYDLFALENSVILPGSVTSLRTGITLHLCPLHYEFYPQIYDKSSVFKDKNIILLNGVIDPGYRGEIKCLFRNFSEEKIHLNKEEPIAQMVFHRVACPKLVEVTVNNVEMKTERGIRGFGQATRDYMQQISNNDKV